MTAATTLHPATDTPDKTKPCGVQRHLGLTALVVIALLTIFSAGTAQAQALFWDGATTSADADGGTGTWDTTTFNWDTAATGGADTTWSNAIPNSAIFGGTAGTVTLGEAITADSLQFDTTGYIVTGNILTLSGNSTVTANQDAEIQSVVDGTSGLTKAGAGILTLSGTNTYTGTTTIDAGTLEIGGAGTLGSGTYAGTIANNGILEFNSSATQTLNGVISGTGALILNGSGQLNLSVNNSFTGGVTVNDGILGLQNGGIGANGPLTVNGGLVSASIHDSFDNLAVSELSGSGGLIEASRRTFTVNQATNTTYAGVIQDLNGTVSSGNGTVFTKSGIGTLTLSGDNTYSKTTNVNGGTLEVSGALYSAGTNGVSSNINVGAAGTLDFTGAGFLGSGAVFDGNIANSGTFNYNSTTDQELSGIISGAGVLTKDNTSTLTLSGANSYTGDTTITAGTLQLDGSLTSDVTVASGANLDGEGSTTGALVFSGTTHTINADVDTAAALGSTTSTDVSALNVGGFIVNVTGSATGAQEILHYGTTFTGAVDRFVAGSGVSARGAGGFSSRTWNDGSADGLWNSTSSNWVGGDNLFFDGDNVTFSDAATTKAVVINGANVAPGPVTFNNTSGGGAYTLSSAAGETLDGSGGISATGTGDVTISSDIIGSGGFTQSGTGTTILSGANTYTGVTTINAGTLVAGVADVAATSGALGNGGNITFAGGTLQYTANSAGSDYGSRISNSNTAAITIDTNGQNVNLSNVGVSGATANGTLGLVKNGTGTLTVDAASDIGGKTQSTIVNDGKLIIRRDTGDFNMGNNYRGGDVFINNGSTVEIVEDGQANLVINNNSETTFVFDSSGGGSLIWGDDASASGQNLIVQGANTGFQTNGGVQNTVSGRRINLQSNTANILQFDVADGSDDTDLLFSVEISNGGGLTKTGAGTLELTSTVGTGTTAVTAGRVILNTTANTSDVVVSSGATLGGEATAGSITFLAGATNLEIDGDTAVALTTSGALTTTGSTVTVTGAIGSGIVDVINYGSFVGAASAADFTFSGVSSARGSGPTFADTGSKITVQDTGIVTNTWNGSNSLWDINTSANWTNASDTVFFDLDNVVFTDGATNKTPILREAVTASSVEFSNTAGNDYTLSSDGSEVLTVNDAVTLSGTGNVTINSVIAGSGALNQTGTGTTTLNGANTYTGVTAISDGILVIGNDAALGSTAAGTTISSTGKLNVSGQTIAEGIQVLGKSGTGQIRTLSGETTFTGGISMTSGIDLRTNSGTFRFAGGITGNGEFFNTAASIYETTSLDVQGISFSSTLHQLNVGGNNFGYIKMAFGSPELKIGAGLNNAWNSDAELRLGWTTVNNSRAKVDLNDTSQTVGKLTQANGTVTALEDTGSLDTLNQEITGGGTLTVDISGGAEDSLYFGRFTDGATSTNVVKNGTAKLTLNNQSTTQFSTNTGTFTVNNGILEIKSGNDIGDGATVTLADVAGASLDVNGTGNTETIGGLTGGGTTGGNVNISTGNTLTVANAAAATDTFAGVIAGAGGFTKSGAADSTQTLSGTNTYTGTTTVTNGTLLVDGSTAAGSTVGVNGTSTLGGSGTIIGPTTIAATAFHTAGTTTSAATLTHQGALTYGNDASITWNLMNSSTSAGDMFDLSSGTGALAFDTNTNFEIVFDASIDFNDAFWDNTNPEWLVWDYNATGGTNAASGDITSGFTVSITDNTGSFIGNESSFSFNNDGDGIYLQLTTAIPEPSTYALMGLGLAAFGWVTRRRRIQATLSTENE